MKTKLCILIIGGILGVGCAHEMRPARAIPEGGGNTTLCKQTYFDCRSQCAGTQHKKTRGKCSDQCERDVDTCLLESRSPKG